MLESFLSRMQPESLASEDGSLQQSMESAFAVLGYASPMHHACLHCCAWCNADGSVILNSAQPLIPLMTSLIMMYGSDEYPTVIFNQE